MVRLKATKTSLYRLVAEYTKLPGIRRVEFWKAYRRPDFFLEWSQEDGYAQASFGVCAGRPMLSITVRDIEGNCVSRSTHRPNMESLWERGMVEQFVTAAERRRLERGGDNGGLSPAT